ncbi:hypothetical protein OESDEN_25559 [Oesophagostomum dentatum]|uniref:Saposin B-type domain-containing protein n=1 Tax=Oesophagostomum dentatum TaxID=61180 RepID=A0A0B1RUV0_OESDE|nr:hypothetical protein OESDEN_25559 [Oesophagostomum dentatum]
MRSLCIVALFCLITWTSQKSLPLIFQKKFNCEDACYATVVGGYDIDLSGTAQRLEAKRICERLMSQYWDAPKGFCSKFIFPLLRETKLQKDIKELLDNPSSGLMDRVDRKVRLICAEKCFFYEH